MPIIRRNNCIYTTLGICHSLWMNVWCAGWIMHTRHSSTRCDKYRVSYRYSYFSWWWTHSRPKHVQKRNKRTKKNCAPSWLYTQDYTRMHGQENIKICSTCSVWFCLIILQVTPPRREGSCKPDWWTTLLTLVVERWVCSCVIDSTDGQCTQDEARWVTCMSVIITKVAERRVQMGGFKIACYGVIPRQGGKNRSCNLVYFISARTCTEIVIEMSCQQITQFQRPAGYSVIETYERRGLSQASDIDVTLKLKNLWRNLLCTFSSR